MPEITFSIRVTHYDPGHVHFGIWSGRNTRGKAGELCMRVEEFEEFCKRVKPIYMFWYAETEVPSEFTWLRYWPENPEGFLDCYRIVADE